MRVAGSQELHAPRDDVFRAICDPGVLLEIVPGCDAIEQLSPAEYRGRINLRLPGVTASYRTHVRLVDTVPPERAGMEGHLEGSMGTIDGRADFELTATSAVTTRLDYHGSGLIQGPLAGLDSRFAERLAESLIAQGLRSLDTRLTRDEPRPAAADPKPTAEVPE